MASATTPADGQTGPTEPARPDVETSPGSPGGSTAATAATADEAKRGASLERKRKQRSAESSRRHRARRNQAAEAQADNEARARLEKNLADALTPTFGMVAEAAHFAFLEREDPAFGEKRCREMGDAWAKVLAPHADEEWLQELLRNIPLIAAVSITGLNVRDYAGEISAARRERKKTAVAISTPEPKGRAS